MPTPKQMLWIVGLSAATFLALSRYQAKAAAGNGAPGRFGR